MQETDLILFPSQANNPQDYSIGVIVARFQVPSLTEAHYQLIKYVSNRHPKVLIVLGCSKVKLTKSNPFDFSTRSMMIKSAFPDPKVMVIDAEDHRFDNQWSKSIDKRIEDSYSSGKPLLYGSRDSFIPYYSGKYPTQELDTQNAQLSGTTIRERDSREVVNSIDWRKGFLAAIYSRYPINWMCVDVACLNDQGQVLLGKRNFEPKFRFPGGHYDSSDLSLKVTAAREFLEETGGKSSVTNLTYVTDGKIDDYRYEGLKDGINSTLFVGSFVGSEVKGTDDINEVKWFDIPSLQMMKDGWVEENVIEEHVPFFRELVSQLHGKLANEVENWFPIKWQPKYLPKVLPHSSDTMVTHH